MERGGIVRRPVKDSGSSVSGVGISWIGLQAFSQRFKDRLQGKTTLQVRDEVIKSVTAARKISYAELEPGAFGDANVFVSHAWSYAFLDELVASVEEWMKQQERIPDGGWRFWIDIFNVNQHVDVPNEIDTAAAAQNFRTFSQGFQEQLKKIGRAIFVLSPWDRPVWIFRVWCLYEYYVVYHFKLQYEFVMSPTQKQRFIASLGQDSSNFLGIVSQLDVGKASAFSKYDEIQIKNLVRTDLGGFSKLNEIVVGSIREFCLKESVGALHSMNDEQKAETDLLENTADLLDDCGEFEAAENYLLESLSIKQALHGPEHDSLEKTYRLLGVISSNKGKYDESLKFHEMSRKISVRCHGLEHVDVAKTEKNIGIVLAQKGDLENALLRFQKALSIEEQCLGSHHVDVARTQNNIAIVLEQQGKFDEALEMYEASLKTKREALGEDHVDVAKTQNNIAIVLRQQGKFDEALKMYDASLKTTVEALGHNHVSVAMTKENIGYVYKALGDLAQARSCIADAHSIFLQSLGPDHPNTMKAARALETLQTS